MVAAVAVVVAVVVALAVVVAVVGAGQAGHTSLACPATVRHIDMAWHGPLKRYEMHRRPEPIIFPSDGRK